MYALSRHLEQPIPCSVRLGYLCRFCREVDWSSACLDRSMVSLATKVFGSGTRDKEVGQEARLVEVFDCGLWTSGNEDKSHRLRNGRFNSPSRNRTDHSALSTAGTLSVTWTPLLLSLGILSLGMLSPEKASRRGTRAS
jgi:hypothetical protein